MARARMAFLPRGGGGGGGGDVPLEGWISVTDHFAGTAAKRKLPDRAAEQACTRLVGMVFRSLRRSRSSAPGRRCRARLAPVVRRLIGKRRQAPASSGYRRGLSASPCASRHDPLTGFTAGRPGSAAAQLAAFEMFIEAGHDLDEIAGLVAVVELKPQDPVPCILASPRRTWNHERHRSHSQPPPSPAIAGSRYRSCRN